MQNPSLDGQQYQSGKGDGERELEEDDEDGKVESL